MKRLISTYRSDLWRGWLSLNAKAHQVRLLILAELKFVSWKAVRSGRATNGALDCQISDTAWLDFECAPGKTTEKKIEFLFLIASELWLWHDLRKFASDNRPFVRPVPSLKVPRLQCPMVKYPLKFLVWTNESKENASCFFLILEVSSGTLSYESGNLGL
jgi:hypothetical protein